MKIVVCVGGESDGPELATCAALATRFSITALSAGTEESAGLRAALAMGASRAVFLKDEVFASVDFHTLGQALAAAVRKLEAQLVLTGVRSRDEGLGAVPGALAERLGATLISGAEDVDVLEDGRLAATIRSGGQLRRLAVSGPVVVQIARGPATVPTITARDADVEVMTLDAIGLAAGQIRRRDHLLGVLDPVTRAAQAAASATELLRALGV